MEQSPDIKYQIELLSAANQFAEDFLKFHEQILITQLKYKNQIDQSKISILCQTIDLNQRLENGKPLIDVDNSYIDPNLAASMWREVSDVLMRSKPEDELKEIAALRSIIDDKTVAVKTLLTNLILEKREYFTALSQESGIKLELLIFIARTICLPLLEVHREVLRPNSQVINSGWLRPFCPTCGAAPAMSRLEKEVGQRFLWCSLCNSQWSFHRLLCPLCLNTNQKKLRYLFVAESSPYRVDVCDNCKRYLKTVDERKFQIERPVLMNIEDLLSLSLDEQAKNEGFQNSFWWLEEGM